MCDVLDNAILDKNLPALYKIGWDKTLPGFILSIRNEIVPEISRLLKPETPIVHHFQKDEKLALDPLVLPTNEKWGFGEVIELRENKGDFQTWQIQTPDISPPQKRGEYLWRKAINISVSLNVLATLLSIVGVPGNSSAEPQLISFELSAAMIGFYGFSIWASFSKALADWLRTLGEERNLDRISQTMHQSWMTMFPEDNKDRRSDLYEFRAWYRPPCWINLTVPGNACGLDPNDYYDHGTGYKLSPHNTDTPVQQLSLLAGVAALCDLWREANIDKLLI